jgi:Tfp pilus assembly protein PilO
MKITEMLQRMTMMRALMLGLILCAIYYVIMFDNGRNQEAAIAASQAQLTELQHQISDSQAKLDRAAVYKTSVAQLGTTIQKLLSVIPEKFSTPDLQKILSNEAKVAGSSLASITPGKTAEFAYAKEFEELNVSIDLSGSFMQHMVFLSNLTKIPQILIVRKFDLGVAQGGPRMAEDAVNVHMTADIVAYRYKGQTVATSPAVPGGTPPPNATPPPPPPGGQSQ